MTIWRIMMTNKSNELVSPSDLLMTNSPISAEQMQVFYRRTPADKVYQRPARGGGQWCYVQTGYVIETLNRVFGYLWSFEVKTSLDEAMKGSAGGTCVVAGRLTAIVNGITLVKEQFGRSEVKYRKGTKEFLDFGNDMKAAASDALKKCASEFGLFSDIYHGDDFVEYNLVSDEERRQIEAKESDIARGKLLQCKSLDELRRIFVGLKPTLRQQLVNVKDQMKANLKNKEERGEGTKSTAEQ